MPKPSFRPSLLSLLAVLALSGCHVYGHSGYGYGAGPEVTKPAGGPVPPGHMPPPGLCRIWHPGTPPGQQPPPGNCAVLQYQVPPGAILVGPG